MNRTLAVPLVLLAVVVVAPAVAADPPGQMVSPGVAKSGSTDPLKSRWDDPRPDREIDADVDRSTAHMVLPAEAAPVRKRRVRAEFMNSSQVAAYFRKGGDMAILPVGGQVATASHLPCGAPSFNTHAAAIMVAEQCGALAFPPIPYGAAVNQRGLPGTVSIPLEETLEYTQRVVESLFECGFKRVVLVGPEDLRDHLGALACRLYRDQRKLIFAGTFDLLPAGDAVKAELGYEAADDIRTMASLRILGYPGVFEPGPRAAAPEGPTISQEVLERMGKMRVGAVVPQGSPSAGPQVRDTIKPEDVAKAIGVMRREARGRSGLGAVYARYIKQMADWEAMAPYSAAGWDKGVASCRFDAIPENDVTPTAPGPDLSALDVRLPLSQLSEEAQPESLRRHRAEFMSPAQMAARMKDDPVAILPCGAFEMHGPHGLLGTDTFEAHSEAVMLARATDGIAFPPIFYTYAGATERYPGTVSPSSIDTARYVRAVVRGLLDAGFRRVCILWVHGPGGQMKRLAIDDLYQETGQVVFVQRVWLFGGGPEALGYRIGEDIRTLVGLKILGHPGVFVVDEPEDIGIMKLSFHTLVESGHMGVRPTWYMGLPTQHLAVRKCVRTGDDDKLLPLMRESAKAYADTPAVMDEYLKEIERLRGGRR
ncbi:MAG: creatininase family protein [Planctomycetes bacterium]|nr:creatininase family protein [Planctomycetota bacterium]